MNQHELLIEWILNEIQDTEGNDSCIISVDKPGELTYYLDNQIADEFKIMLARNSNDATSRTFTIQNANSIQIGYVNIDTNISDWDLKGTKYQIKSVNTQWDILLFVHDPDIKLKLEYMVRAFSNIADCRLEHIEVNPIQTMVRHALMPPKYVKPDIKMRAYAFTYWTSFHPTIQ